MHVGLDTLSWWKQVLHYIHRWLFSDGLGVFHEYKLDVFLIEIDNVQKISMLHHMKVLKSVLGGEYNSKEF